MLLPFDSLSWWAAAQQQDPVASTRFLSAQFQRIVVPVGYCSCRPGIDPQRASDRSMGALQSRCSARCIGTACLGLDF